MDTADDEVFELRETRDGPGVQLIPAGELDIAASEQLSERLAALKAAGTPVQLDLAEVVFMDSTGVACIARAVRESRQDGWDLSIGHQLQAQVSRLMELVDGAKLFWPEGP
jgi:anti-anti-sigma factor